MQTARELRAQRARQQVPLYKLAPAVGVHPTRLGAMLRERIPMPLAVAERIAKALAESEWRGQ